MKWHLHKSTCFLDLYAELASHEKESSPANPLLHPDFVHTAIEHFGDTNTYILVGSHDDAPSVLLPVSRCGFGKWRSFSPSQLPIAPFYCRTESRHPIDFESSFDALPRSTMLFEILNYDSDYAPPVLCRSANANRTLYGTTISIDCRLGFSDYWQNRPKKLRDNIRRYTRRATNAGKEISLRIAAAPEELQRSLATYGEIESAGWKGRTGTAISMSNAQGRFYSEILEKFALRQDARIFELTFNGETVASRIAIQWAETIVFLKTTYSEEFAKFSPGRLLLHSTIREYLDSGRFGRLEFCTNATPDTLQWGSVSREIVHLNLYRNTAVERSKQVLDSIRRNIPRRADRKKVQ